MSVEDETIAELFAKQPVVRCHSSLLGEIVVFATDDAQVTQEGDEVVYREWELHQLANVTPEVRKAVHKVKKMFDGELVPEEEARAWQGYKIFGDRRKS